MACICKHEPSEAELKLMAEQFGFRFNNVGAYQRDLANDWAIIIAPRLARKKTTWIAKLDHKSIIKQWATKFSDPYEAAEFAFAKWRKWL